MQSPTGNRRRRLEGFPTWALLAAGVALVLTLVVLARREPGTRARASAGVSLAHVHGLGLTPANGDLASHFGLFRVRADGRAERVGDRAQDTMGFTVAGPDHFLASGHPDPRDARLRRPGRPPLLGLIESTDGGRSWQPLSLLGEADFHFLVAIDGRIYGYDSTGGRFMASTEGKQWETRSRLALGDFAVDPTDADRVVAITERGLAESGDGGRTWAPLEGPRLAVLAWAAEQGLWGVSMTGETYRRIDGRWERRVALDGQPQALLVAGKQLYAAVSSGNATAIYVSSDGAGSWRLRYSDEAA